MSGWKASTLPPAYRWLGSVGTLPRMLAEGLELYGVRETAGAADNPVILQWAREAGVAGYRADATAWCGLFLAVAAKRAGWTVPDGPLWALNWGKFGVATARPMLGDVMTFVRPGGGHVGLYVGEDAAAWHVLGGNQDDRVGFARIARGRMRAVRRPPYRRAPATVAAHRLAATGKLSVDEA
ncbi:TIGR02594 family protein [Sphingomonas montana]|uniref:TIGR02594 family protein n=1 Tax=Sphingomonas montana TaxID=1843236 RepID=UPI00096CDC73|nr:TIGR02594 family protein [Sphingomonas montana]